jgi:hypothetical protein
MNELTGAIDNLKPGTKVSKFNLKVVEQERTSYFPFTDFNGNVGGFNNEDMVKVKYLPSMTKPYNKYYKKDDEYKESKTWDIQFIVDSIEGISGSSLPSAPPQPEEDLPF